eukprot:279655_1
MPDEEKNINSNSNINNSKFVTSMTEDEEKLRESYYSFGTQYRYTSNFATHPLHIEAKYNSIKEELVEYFKSMNEKQDKANLFHSQTDTINYMNSNDQALSLQLINEKYDELEEWIWIEDIKEDIDDEKDKLLRIVQMENANSIRIQQIFKNLFDEIPSIFYSNCTFITLLNLKFKMINVEILQQIQEYFQNMDKDKLVQLLHILHTTLEEVDDENTQNYRVVKKNMKSIFRNIFDKDTKKCFNNKDDTKKYFNKNVFDIAKSAVINLFKETLFDQKRLQEQEQIVESDIIQHLATNRNVIADVFHRILILHFDRKRFHSAFLKKKYKSGVMHQMAYEWIHSQDICRIHEGINTDNIQTISVTTQTEQLNRMLQIGDYIDYKDMYQKVKRLFITYAKSTLEKALIENQKKYIERENEQRFEPFYRKAQKKSEMNSVKRIKAMWYHGINEQHHIMPNDALSINHITAMICYSDDGKLCTLFRESYRRKSKDETLEQQKRRHEKFCNFGKLLYESFVFYGNTNGRIKTLYHGISIPLLFPTLHCAFDAPISCTTASNIASGFGEGGIVLQFDSSDSSQYIKTLDMELFSCYEQEEEHLIFETRLHIKDIFIPSERVWFGQKW